MRYFKINKKKTKQRGNWLRLLCNGDKAAFTQFVDEYQQVVFLCCKTLGLNETEADDVASETFLTVYQKLSTFKGQSKLSTWLWKIAYHKGIDYIRKNKHHMGRLGEIDEQLADKSIAHIAAELENKEQSQIVWDAVRTLPGDWSIAILLYYRQNKSIKEISKIMKKRENTVKIYLFRGRKKLKGLLAGVLGDIENGSKQISQCG
jgi:RNA polymerase sigma-70 factor (ECF subfamily)